MKLKKVSNMDKKVSDSDKTGLNSILTNLQRLSETYKVELKPTYYNKTGEAKAVQVLRPDEESTDIPFQLLYMETSKGTICADFKLFERTITLPQKISCFTVLPDRERRFWMIFWIEEEEIADAL